MTFVQQARGRGIALHRTLRLRPLTLNPQGLAISGAFSNAQSETGQQVLNREESAGDMIWVLRADLGTVRILPGNYFTDSANDTGNSYRVMTVENSGADMWVKCHVATVETET